MKTFFFYLFACLAMQIKAQEKSQPQVFKSWLPGELDIHFINTGRGNSSFIVMPDGTNMLIDAGDLNQTAFETSSWPLKITPALPNNSRRPGEWIAEYIKQVMPADRKPAIDFALITHFHSDHYGLIQKSSTFSSNGAYQLSGLTDVAEQIPILNLLDRGHSFPVDLVQYYAKDLTFMNYLAFIKFQQKSAKFKYAALQAGSDQQIKLLSKPNQFPEFSVRAIKASNRMWNGKGKNDSSLFSSEQIFVKGKFNENPLSNAIKITYGPFSFYSGGDNTGYEGSEFPGRKDVETPIAKVIGRIDAMSLNHHGNRDANNSEFLKALCPSTVIEQSWCSDHPGQELAFRLTRPNSAGDSIRVFDTYLQEGTKSYLGFWIIKSFKSLEGHVLVRVMTGGASYFVYILDDNMAGIRIVKSFGPYFCKQK